MVNIRINGSKTEIRRFIKILRRVKQVYLHEDSISDFHKMRKLGFYNKYLNISCLHDKDKNKLNK